MAGIEFIKQILEPSYFATNLDLQDAYHHIRVSDQLLPYFGFAFMRKTFAYRGLPFGYRISPYIFNITIQLAIRAIRRRRKSLKMCNYIDDIILIHKCKIELKRITFEVIDFHNQSGLTIVFNTDGSIKFFRGEKIDQNYNYKIDLGCHESTNYSSVRFCESEQLVKFSMVSVPEGFIKPQFIESTEMLSNQEERLELQSEIVKNNPKKSLLMADSYFSKQTMEIFGTTITYNSNYRCSRIGMGLKVGDSESQCDGCRQVEQKFAFEQLQLTRNSCSPSITLIIYISFDIGEDQVFYVRDRQLDSGILNIPMERIIQQNTFYQSYISISISIQDQPGDSPRF
ncbi:MAG: hypothetical protein EZS28_042078 [Streblomastix strix]|uniref:Reverse transcriptase domain-containing protein n=1 Tax=Streblomastix strix TaxID=222440 RepID=A0A5J4TV69_9EUKA|nr:MAG: hypothetical protein EZS28_042078 [Streblomastix strix]